MAAPAAGAAPEAGLGLAAIATALGWLVLGVSLWVYRRSLGKLLVYAANKADNIALSIPHVATLRPLAPFAAVLRYVHKQIDHYLAEGMLACEKATVYLLHAMYALLRWMGREIADLAEATEHALGLQRVVNVPATVKALTAPLRATLAQLRRSVAAVDRQLDAAFGRARKGIDALERVTTRTLPRAIGRVSARVGRIERDLSSRAYWKRHLSSTLGASAFAALVVTALGRLGLGWLRCGNVKKAGRSVCGMRGDLLDDLLLGLATLTVGLNLVAFAEEMGEVIEETADFIGDRVT